MDSIQKDIESMRERILFLERENSSLSHRNKFLEGKVLYYEQELERIYDGGLQHEKGGFC